MTITGKHNSYEIDNTVTISDNRKFSFKNCICVFHISIPDENGVFIRRYVDAQYFKEIDEKIFKSLTFGKFSPTSVDVIKIEEEKSEAIIKDIKEGKYYIG